LRRDGGQRLPDQGVTLIEPPGLADLGISKMQSSRWQKLGAMDDEAFERRVEVAKGRAIAAIETRAPNRKSPSHGDRVKLHDLGVSPRYPDVPEA
jgi:hypothetical protein